MRPGAVLGAYGLVLAAALGGGAAAGAIAGPIDVGGAPVHERHDETQPAVDHEVTATGLTVTTDGYTLAVQDRVVQRGPFELRILGPAGEAVTDFAELHEKRLHLIVVSRDLGQYHHLHPTMAADGRWTAQLPELPGGSYRAFADFQPSGADGVTLGIDLSVPGTMSVAEPPAPTDQAVTGPYTATLDGPVAAGSASRVTITVRRDGTPVTTEPYLGARGHLVVLRDGDLAYLHVHPHEGDSKEVAFTVEVPSAGRYALFFDFRHDGVVRTARFVLDVDHPTSPPSGAHQE